MSNMSFIETAKHIGFYKTYCIFLAAYNLTDDLQLSNTHNWK